MSRGPGRWQRVLLAALDEYDLVPVIDVVWNEVGREPSRAELVAARRSARRLAEDGHARAIYCWRCTSCGALVGPWTCCGHVTHSLVLTRSADIKTVLPTRRPRWISVASSQAYPLATHSKEGDDDG